MCSGHPSPHRLQRERDRDTVPNMRTRKSGTRELCERLNKKKKKKRNKNKQTNKKKSISLFSGLTVLRVVSGRRASRVAMRLRPEGAEATRWGPLVADEGFWSLNKHVITGWLQLATLYLVPDRSHRERPERTAELLPPASSPSGYAYYVVSVPLSD